MKENPQGAGLEVTGGTQAGSLTQTKNLLQKRKSKPAYMQSLNEHEKAENFKIIDNMNKKISYKKNPRYTVNKAPILFTQVSRITVKQRIVNKINFSFRPPTLLPLSMIRRMPSVWSHH